MGKGYEDLSRRALIKLGRDYDQESDAALLEFLTEHGDEYENIRFTEKILEKADQLKESVCGSTSTVKKVISKEADKLLDSTIDILTSITKENTEN